MSIFWQGVFSLQPASDCASLDKVEHVDEVGVVDVPALDAHDVRKHVEVGARTHAAVEDDPETEKMRRSR